MQRVLGLGQCEVPLDVHVALVTGLLCGRPLVLRILAARLIIAEHIIQKRCSNKITKAR